MLQLRVSIGECDWNLRNASFGVMLIDHIDGGSSEGFGRLVSADDGVGGGGGAENDAEEVGSDSRSEILALESSSATFCTSSAAISRVTSSSASVARVEPLDDPDDASTLSR